MRRAPDPWLVAIVGASFVVRTALGWLRATPVFFPDEYIYAALGRSLAESGRPSIRGGSAHFPALLQPILTAPAWLIDDVGVAYRSVQTLGALAMSMAAVPVYLLAERLGLSRRVALALSALAALVPDLVYASYVSSEALAYPLVLLAVFAAVRALVRPTRKAQLAFVGLAVLATLARAQLAILPLVFAVAAVAVGAREGRVRDAVRESALPLGLFAVMAAAAVGSGPAHVGGIYRSLLDFDADPAGIAHSAALDAMMLAYAAGWIVVPGALVGLWLAVSRPRSREELAFGAVASVLLAALLLEAAFLQASLPVSDRVIEERYVFYAVPSLGLCFALYAARGWPLRLAHLAIAAALVVVSVRVPLSGYAVSRAISGSAVLYAVAWLGRALGALGDAAAVVAATVGVLSGVAVLASRRPRLATPVVFGLAILATGALSAGAVAMVVDTTTKERRALLPTDPSWVDHAHVGRTVLLQSWGGNSMVSFQALFWNRSLDRLLLLPGALPVDGFRTERARIDKNGFLFADGRDIRSALVVDGFGSTTRLRDARLVTAGPTATLSVPTGAARLSLYATGRYYDGWLAGRGTVQLWPEEPGGRLAGWLSMRIETPGDADAGTLTFALPRGRSTSVRLSPGVSRHVRVAVCASGAWRATYGSTIHRLVGLRLVSVRSGAPVFRPDPSACSALRSRPTGAYDRS